MNRFVLIVLVLLLVTGLVSGCTPPEAPESEVPPEISEEQQSLFNDLTGWLIEDGVPVIDSEMRRDADFNNMMIADFTLQSNSDKMVVAPEDPVFTNKTAHAANIAKNQGLEIDACGITILNTGGEIIRKETTVLKGKLEQSLIFNQPGTMNVGELVPMLEALTSTVIPLIEVSVTPDREGFMTVHYEFEAGGVDDVNRAGSLLTTGLAVEVNKLNSTHDAGISLCWITVLNPQGDILLNYICDFQFTRQSWWQAEGVTKVWFPYPEPADNTTVTIPHDYRMLMVNRSFSTNSSILFSGTSLLPDGTVLVSQLDEDGAILDWWPDDREVVVENGKWKIIVIKGDTERTADLELKVGPGYHFYIWQKDDPEIKGGFYFDLVGPLVDILDEK